jgi:hypothetical protein
MDCKTAQLLLELAHPRRTELDEGEADLLEAHLAECGDCRLQAEEELRLDSHLGTAVRAVTVPAGLREKLLFRMQAERSARLRQKRLRLAGWVAAAATVLVALTVGWLSWPVEGVNLAAIHSDHPPRNAAEVERRLAELGVRTVAPPQFNYNWLASLHLVEFDGRKRVPHLLFVRNGAVAEVYILSARQFNRVAIVDQGKIDSGGYTVEAQSHDDNPDVFYLIKYKGDSLQRFLVQDAPAT